MQLTKSILIERALIGVFWVLGSVGFICDEFVPGLESLRSYIMLACDAALVLLGLMCLKHRADIIFIVSLLLIALTSSLLLNHLPLAFTANGMRVFIGIMFCYPIFRYFMDEENRREHFIKTFDKHLEVFLWLQVPCIGYQFLLYGADDHGGGSLGNWNSGTVSMMIYLISFYLMRKRIDPKHFMGSIMNNFKYVLLLTPTFFNETKISFALLVIYFVLLLPIDKRLFTRALFITPILSILFLVGYTTYQITYKGDLAGTTAGSADIFSEEYLIEYIFSDIEDAEDAANWSLNESESGMPDVPRLTKFLLLPMFEEDNPGHIPLGFGVGHFKGGTKMSHSELFDYYEWYMLGTIPYLIHIYLQIGIVGLLWYFTYLVSLFVRRPKGCSKRDLNLQLFLLLLIGMNFFYSDSMRDPIFCIVLYGLAAFAWLPDASADEKALMTQEIV
ncbi:MAG: hypothetical protein IKZ92_06705 [Muribaculaceae bacterium]|nr:hypothetical protein [Muribaculaceae bacterium]